jgi:hypothetical protein
MVIHEPQGVDGRELEACSVVALDKLEVFTLAFEPCFFF